MFQITEVIKRLFTDLTPEEEYEEQQKQEWADVKQIAKFPAYYPNFDADRVCKMIQEDYPDMWYQNSEAIIEIAKKAEEEYYL